MIGAVSRFPEWKALYDAILPLIQGGQTAFGYEELDALSGLDIRSDRGRGQFYRFRRELLKVHQLWMENIPGSGYIIIDAKDQPHAAFKRVRSARRKVNMARAINSNVRIEDLTPEQRLLQAATSAVLHELSKTFHSVGHKFHLASKEALKLPVDLPKLIESIANNKEPEKPARKDAIIVRKEGPT
jgi:hypothetical protein